jgi:hypothetical protein
MARPKVKEKRDKQLNLKITARELELLRARAAAAGVRPVDYGRARLFAEWRATARQAATPHLDPLLIAALSRIGNNLNQITRRLNTLDIPAPPSLEPLLREIRTLIAGVRRS